VAAIMKERRRYPRHVVWFPVHLDAGELGEGVAVSKNASTKGILVAAATDFSVGAPVRISFRVLPVDQTPRRIEGTIVRIVENTEDPRGPWPYKMAVEFDEPVEDLEQILRSAAGDEPPDEVG
jgi:hypothetical protein